MKNNILRSKSLKNPRTSRTFQKQAVYRQMGYEDALAGRGFRAEYERWEAPNQVAYEFGRVLVANIRCAKVAAPEWRKGVILPTNLIAASGRAAALVGPCYEKRAA